jgi:tol-pal system protein YbgF
MTHGPLLYRAALVVLALAASGCAMQSTVVDMERNLAALQYRMDKGGITAPVGQVNPATAEAAGVSATEVLDLTISVDQLQLELSEARGQLDEMAFALTSLVQSSDARLALLEEKAGITSAPSLLGGPSLGSAADPGAEQLAPPAVAVVGTTEALTAVAPELGVVMPGVMIAPRDRDVPSGISAKTAFSLANADFKRGHYNLSAAGFANFLEQYPASNLTPEAHFWLGESYRSQGLQSRATRVWEQQVQAFSKHKTTPMALLRLGEVYHSMDNIPAAEKSLKTLIAGFPVSAEAQQAKLLLSEMR